MLTRLRPLSVEVPQELPSQECNACGGIISQSRSLSRGSLGRSDSNPTVRIETVVKCLAMSLVAVVMLAGVRASDAAVRIGQDRGGRMGAYVDKYQGLRSSGEMIIIDGACLSACTIVLGSVPRDKICVTSRARFGFHAAWNPASNGRKKTNPEATHTLYSLYPSEVQRWIDQRGGLSPRMIFLSGRDLAAMYRPCDRDSRASSH